MALLGAIASQGLAPKAPTIGTATAGDTSATVAYTAPTWVGKGSGAVTYTATSSPGSFTGTGTSPITVSGLTNGTAYTFTVKATTSYGVTGPSSAASNSITPAASASYESIQTVTVGSGGTSSISFTSIATTWTHLQIRCLGQTNRASSVDSIQLTFNSDTGSNYSWHTVQGDGSSATTLGYATQNYARIGDGTIGGATASSGYVGAGVIDILDYKSTNKYKTIRGLTGVDENGGGRVGLGSGLWQNSSTAISSINIAPQGGTLFLQYSSFALYGIKG